MPFMNIILTKISQIASNFISNIHQLFLIDSIGAILSVMAALTVAQFDSLFGIPAPLLYKLVILGSCFSLCSFLCFFIKVKKRRFYMKLFATFNLLYCCLTAGLIVYLCQSLTILGLLFFISEIIIIVVLAFIELKTAANH
jgi:hypothetical protein